MEVAVEGEHARMVEGKSERPSIPRQKHIRASMTGCVEYVVADHGVVVGIAVDPLHGLPDPNGDLQTGLVGNSQPELTFRPRVSGRFFPIRYAVAVRSMWRALSSDRLALA